MVRPPERTDAARSHDIGNEVSQPPDMLRDAARPAAGLGWATLGYPSAAMALRWAKELAPQPLPLGYHVEKCRSGVKPGGESGAGDVGGERGWTSRLQTSLGAGTRPVASMVHPPN